MVYCPHREEELRWGVRGVHPAKSKVVGRQGQSGVLDAAVDPARAKCPEAVLQVRWDAQDALGWAKSLEVDRQWGARDGATALAKAKFPEVVQEAFQLSQWE